MSNDKYIPMSTTDSLPTASDRERAIEQSYVAWSASANTIQEAYDSLAGSVRENGFDAVIGVRIMATPFVGGGGGPYGSNSVYTEVEFRCYGTVIKYSAE
jgi:hypothetical protein